MRGIWYFVADFYSKIRQQRKTDIKAILSEKAWRILLAKKNKLTPIPQQDNGYRDQQSNRCKRTKIYLFERQTYYQKHAQDHSNSMLTSWISILWISCYLEHLLRYHHTTISLYVKGSVCMCERLCVQLYLHYLRRGTSSHRIHRIEFKHKRLPAILCQSKHIIIVYNQRYIKS